MTDTDLSKYSNFKQCFMQTKPILLKNSHGILITLLLLLFFSELHLAVLGFTSASTFKDHSWQGTRDHMGCWGSNSGQLHIWPVS